MSPEPIVASSSRVTKRYSTAGRRRRGAPRGRRRDPARRHHRARRGLGQRQVDAAAPARGARARRPPGALVVGRARARRRSEPGLRRFRRERVAFVSQRAADNFFPHLTVAEHLSAGACGSRVRAARDRARGSARAPPSSPAASSRARRSPSRSPAASPLVVVDEPTAELDRESAGARARCARATRASRGTTFVVATHDPEVIAIADHVIDLDAARRSTGAARIARPPARSRRRRRARGDAPVEVATADVPALDDVVARAARGRARRRSSAARARGSRRS